MKSEDARKPIKQSRKLLRKQALNLRKRGKTHKEIEEIVSIKRKHGLKKLVITPSGVRKYFEHQKINFAA